MNKFLLELEEDINYFDIRYKSILTIPCIIGKRYEKNINYILELVLQNPEIDDKKLSEILVNKNRLSEVTAKNVRPTMERANLLLKQDKIIKLTHVSKKYIEEKDSAYLGKGFVESYFVLLEIICLVEKCEP